MRGVQSTVSEMDKAELLRLLDMAETEEESPFFSVQELEGDEDVEAWIQLIREFMLRCVDNEILFSELVRKRILTQGKAWMAVLLGGFHLDQQGDFYEGVVRVRSRV